MSCKHRIVCSDCYSTWRFNTMCCCLCLAAERAAKATLDAERAQSRRRRLELLARRHSADNDAFTTTSDSSSLSGDDSCHSDHDSVTSSADDDDVNRTDSHFTGRQRTGDDRQRAPATAESRQRLSRGGQQQVSKDSGMPSEGDVSAASSSVPLPMTTSTQSVTSQRLRHSKSWPDRKERRRSSATPDACGDTDGNVASLDLGESMDDVSSCRDDLSGVNQLNARARSSHEFTFSIPADTSQSSSTVPQSRDSIAQSPDIDVTRNDQEKLTAVACSSSSSDSTSTSKEATRTDDGVSDVTTSTSRERTVVSGTSTSTGTSTGYSGSTTSSSGSAASSSTGSPTSGNRVSFVTEALMEAFVVGGPAAPPAANPTIEQQLTAACSSCRHEHNNNSSVTSAPADNADSSDVMRLCSCDYSTQSVSAADGRQPATHDSDVCPQCSKQRRRHSGTAATREQQQTPTPPPACSNCSKPPASSVVDRNTDEHSGSDSSSSHHHDNSGRDVTANDATVTRSSSSSLTRNVRYFRSQSCPQPAGRRTSRRNYSDRCAHNQPHVTCCANISTCHVSTLSTCLSGSNVSS